jgi:hypothetical protein
MDVGDLTERKELRKRLNCKSFKWFLDNVIPEKFIPDENVKAYGLVRTKQNLNSFTPRFKTLVDPFVWTLYNA